MIAWLWTFYFGVKIGLYFRGVVDIHFWPNLALLILAMPFSPTQGRPLRKSTILRQCASIPLGAALFWYDSYLPPFLYSARFLIENKSLILGGFLNQFILIFLSNKAPLAVFFLLLALCLFAAKKKLHPTPAVFLALSLTFVLGLRKHSSGILSALDRFYSEQLKMKVSFPADSTQSPFDIILIHVCSLSWDDLAYIKESNPDLFKYSNFIFTNFNSATSYSAPSALRLLRAPCGQIPHAALYQSWPPECGLLWQLRQSGYKTYAALNSDPDYYDMARQLHKFAGLDSLVSISGLPVQMLSFDDQPVFANAPVLKRWLKKRDQDGARRAMLYYNTISLHTGGHPNAPGWWKKSALQRYPAALAELGREIQSFEDRIAHSGRDALIVIVPEHGAALRGSAIQAAELRDIPLPRITEVPVAIRLMGPMFKRAPVGIKITTPVSYLALARLLSDFISDPSIGARSKTLKAEIKALPRTRFLSETEYWKVFKFHGRYYILGKDGSWRLLPRDIAASAKRGIL